MEFPVEYIKKPVRFYRRKRIYSVTIYLQVIVETKVAYNHLLNSLLLKVKFSEE